MTSILRLIGYGSFVGGIVFLLQMGYQAGLQSVDTLVEQSYGNHYQYQLPGETRSSLQEIEQAYRSLPTR